MAKKKSDAEKARAKENYTRLREIGFTSKEASRYRHASQDKVERAILDHYIPAPKASKQGAAKPIVSNIEYEKLNMRGITLKNLSPSQFKKVEKLIEQGKKDGFNYFNVVITQKGVPVTHTDKKTGESKTVLEDLARTYNPKKTLSDGRVIEQGAMIPANTISSGQDLQSLVAAATESVMSRYGVTFDDVGLDDEEEESDQEPEIEISINMWQSK